jgi:hypothetical protein
MAEVDAKNQFGQHREIRKITQRKSDDSSTAARMKIDVLP